MIKQKIGRSKKARRIAPCEGKLGVLLPGMGAVSTTLIAGVLLINKGLAEPIGSLTQMQKIRLGNERCRATRRSKIWFRWRIATI